MKKILWCLTFLLLFSLLCMTVAAAEPGVEEGVTLSPANTVMGEWDSYILGDADMDGKITNADALAIFRYLYDAEQYPLPILCNHTFGEWTVADKPTCQKEGLKTRSCSKCNGTEEEVLPIVDHNYLATVIAPTQTEQGYTKHTCDMCGDSYNDTFVAPTGKTEGLDYTVNADGTTCTVTGLGGCTGPVINIPSEIDGYTVTAIGDRAFAEKTALTAIYIPDTVKTIGTRAFYACSGLSEMTIPASVTSIGTQIFYKCDNLKTVYYNSTYSSSSNLFFSQSSVEKVVFGGKKVPSYICQNSAKIEMVEITDGVTNIGYSAFSGCTSLASITIPNSVISIGEMAFSHCTSLVSISIPDSVTSIGNYAFDGCTSLASITISDSVTSIGFATFQDCTSLRKVYITNLECWLKLDFEISVSNPLYNGADLYLNNVLVTNLTIPDSVTNISYGAFFGCTSLVSITIPDGVASIGDYAFHGCTSLASITIPDSVTSIGERAFNGCTSLASITIPDSVTSIGDYAFYNCTNLASITIPDSITSISSSAFKNCTSLTAVYYTGVMEDWNNISGNDNLHRICYYYAETKPASAGAYWHYVNGIPTPWFEALEYTMNYEGTSYYVSGIGNCTGDVIIPETWNDFPVTFISDHAFYGCTDLTSIIIPDSVTAIGYKAFSGCTNLTRITIPDSVTSFGNYAFQDCKMLSYNQYDNAYYLGTTSNPYFVLIKADNTSSCQIHSETKSIGAAAFSNCTNLISITIPDNVTRIGERSFWRCTSLTSITIGNGVTHIGDSAFEECSSLAIIEIPYSVTHIGLMAFMNTNLESVIFKNPAGWWVVYSGPGTPIAEADLKDTAKAASYLSSTYYRYYWKRS